jgi:hypothetical protein
MTAAGTNRGGARVFPEPMQETTIVKSLDFASDSFFTRPISVRYESNACSTAPSAGKKAAAHFGMAN